MTHTVKTVSIPRVGMFATVRNRRGIVAAVEPFDGDTGRLHLVHLEYKDDQYPIEEELLWELEPHKNLLEPTALPLTSSTDPMPREDFDALLRASRWTAAMPYLDPEGDDPLDRKPITSPFHGAVQVEDFQLVPLLKALLMPRVNLLIADDVLEQFLAACRTPEGSPHLPWDLLIVDECHNLMPSAFGDDSDLCRMLRLLAPQFEHRLFLSATPHNGHTRCFTGLLEILDRSASARRMNSSPLKESASSTWYSAV